MAQETLIGGYHTAAVSSAVNVVISGTSGRFPNSHNVSEFVRNLLNKKHLCDEEQRGKMFTHPEVPKLRGKMYDVDIFDSGFFATHPYHAYYTDPMGRIFLEQVVGALFDAGIHPDDLKTTSTGLFVGSCASEYELMMYKLHHRDTHIVTGTIRSMVAQRVAYWLQINGPAVICDTACSSGMYALEHGYRAIIEGRCEVAIVGATNLCLDQYMTLQFARLGVLNYGCGCRPFDEDACGYTRSEAVVAIILQKQKDAKRVYARVVHAQCNADGFKTQGITFPSFEGQFSVLSDVYKEVSINPDEIGFIEAHGTGTKVGDPEELSVLDEFFKPTQEEPLLIGSVKGNIGHTEPVSGLCSVVKCLSMLNSNIVIPNIHYNKPRSGIKALVEKRIQVVTNVQEFPPRKKYAGVNCFGFGGANGHVILEKFNKHKNVSYFVDPPRLVCYSGRTEEAIDNIHKRIVDCKDIDLLSLLQECYSKSYRSELFRGYTLVGTNERSKKGLQTVLKERVLLHIDVFHRPQENALKKIPLIVRISTELDVLQCQDTSMRMQFILIKLFKELQVDIIGFGKDIISKAIQSYFDNCIDFKQLVHIVSSNKTNVISQNINDVQDFINDRAFYQNKLIIIAIGSTNPNYSSKTATKCETIHFGDNMNIIQLLSNIGRLYEQGYNPQIQKLYADVQFPVSSGTDHIAHLLQLKQKPFNMLSWGKSTFFDSERKDLISMVNADSVFYRGHMIDNKNLFPATGYLWHIWNMFGDLRDLHPTSLSVIFEDVRFHRACTIQDKIELYLVIQNDGRFEVSENDVTAVTGRIYQYNEKEQPDSFMEVRKLDENYSSVDYVMSAKDSYKELRLRGYNYKGLFRAIHEVSSQRATIEWNNNWVTFLDNMMQVCILAQDTRKLFVPVGIDRLVIRPKQHLEYVKELEGSLVPINFERSTKRVFSKFVEIHGLHARAITRRKERMMPVLEKYQFMPNELSTTIETSIRINVQILLECKQILHFKVVEALQAEDEDVISRHVCNVIEDLPLVLPEMTLVTSKENFEVENVKVETAMTDQNLLFICKSPGERELQEADKALIEDGFLLCICNAGFKLNFPSNMIILTKHTVEDKIVLLLRKQPNYDAKPIVIDVTKSKEYNWLKEVQHAMQTCSEVIVFAQNNYKSGILGFTNCLTKEPNNDKVRCFFIQDDGVKFDFNDIESNNDDFKTQFLKHMTVNIFKNGTWGTYRHLLLSQTQRVSADHWYIKTRIPGDLTSISWMQGPLTESNNTRDKPYKIAYSSLNFRDLMLATGKLPAEAVTNDRFLQERLWGIEFSGYDYYGTRVLGIGCGAISNYIDRVYLTLPVPDGWELADAATVTVVYTTVMWALQKMANLRKHQSVLIHSGAGGIGLAAINVCTYYECDIFVTVGTSEKREFLLKHFPNLKSSHIGNSRNTTFKEMICHETSRRGVDVVLNSLAEEKLRASVECLAKGGVFLEIGKYDLDKNSELYLDLVNRDCAYHAVMLDSVFVNATDKTKQELLGLLNNGFRNGFIKALPKTIFQIDQVENAFKYLATGKHIGKVLIEIDDETKPQAIPRVHCKSQHSYIVFGGLGGFGLELSDWLVTRGAKNLILYSRKGITTGYQRYRISLWKSYGVNVVVSLEDVINYENCANALRKVQAIAPIDGIFNLAVVLKDAIFAHQTVETMKASIEPKAQLTQNLDLLTREVCPEMSYFVVFSSVSCGRGNAGQTNYGYSNSVMERICELRHKDGLPALAVQWGAVGDVGLLEELQREHNEIAIGGTLQQKVQNCLQVFDNLLIQNEPIVSSIVVAEKFNKGAANSPIEAVIRILGVTDIKSISPHTPFPELGMDSMMAVEIRQTLEREFDILLGPQDLRSLTFAKLDEMSAGYGRENASTMSEDSTMLAMLIPGVILAKSKEVFIDFCEDASQSPGDFVLVFPGIDADIRSYSKLATVINKHVKCISYDGITTDQENVDVIVDYLEKELLDIMVQTKSFKVIAHSVGSIAAIEFVKRLEKVNITGKLILIDGAPHLMYVSFDVLHGKSDDEFQCNVIEGLISATLPNESIIGLKDILMKGKDVNERADILVNHYSAASQEIKNQLKILVLSYISRVMSVQVYRMREIDMKKQNQKLLSDVRLYKPSIGMVRDIAEDYDLSSICTLSEITTFDGNHMSILENEMLQLQILRDLYN